jgi:hypothetical protein
MGCYSRDVGTIRETNSLNFCNIKFVKLLNNLVVACMVANIFQTPMVGLMDCPTSFSIYFIWSEKFIGVTSHCWHHCKIMRSFWSISFEIFASLEVKIKPNTWRITIWGAWRTHLASSQIKIRESLQQWSPLYILVMESKSTNCNLL